MLEGVNLKEIGEFLKASRISNGVSLEEASDDLNLSVIQLENIEDGNIRAFKDVFALRELVKEYSKYLGLDTDEIIDEFNDFMFEHTSKISLDDILEARKLANEKEEEKPKISSPYTNIPKKKVSINPKMIKYGFIAIGVLLVVVITIFIIIIKINSPEEVISSELRGRELNFYENEFTY